MLAQIRGLLVAAGVTAVAEVLRKCKMLAERLGAYLARPIRRRARASSHRPPHLPDIVRALSSDRSQRQVHQLATDVAHLRVAKDALESQAAAEATAHDAALDALRAEFEEEWAAREESWEERLQSKDEDAQERLDEIATWQEELSRLRSEAIAIRSAIEKVRPRRRTQQPRAASFAHALTIPPPLPSFLSFRFLPSWAHGVCVLAGEKPVE